MTSCPRRSCNVARHNTTDETVITLSLPDKCQGTVHLNSLIKQAFKSSVFTGDCDNCDQRTGRRSILQITKAPQLLVIHILRFRYDVQIGDSVKLLDFVRFGEYQNLTRYHEGKTPLHYRLRSVVQHSGSITDGHYVSVVRGPRGRWMKMNDEQPAERVTMEEAKSVGECFQSYLLFYEREVTPPPRDAVASIENFCTVQVDRLRGASKAIAAGRKRKRVEENAVARGRKRRRFN